MSDRGDPGAGHLAASGLGGGLHPGLLPSEVLFRWMPAFAATRLRSRALRAAGIRMGRTTLFWGLPTLVGGGDICARLTIGEACGFYLGCYFELEDEIRIGEHVSVGHEVMFLTRSHQTGPHAQRAGAPTHAPIAIEDGVWIGSRCTVLPGVRIGAGSVIAASVVVTQDVRPNTLLMGTQTISLAKWR